jgi:hypothetical protein
MGGGARVAWSVLGGPLAAPEAISQRAQLYLAHMDYVAGPATARDPTNV